MYTRIQINLYIVAEKRRRIVGVRISVPYCCKIRVMGKAARSARLCAGRHLYPFPSIAPHSAQTAL
ncbi:hypothetical protein SDJN02_19261, partial [Cucurbita argyrosperma subsp. argyrosperma]